MHSKDEMFNTVCKEIKKNYDIFGFDIAVESLKKHLDSDSPQRKVARGNEWMLSSKALKKLVNGNPEEFVRQIVKAEPEQNKTNDFHQLIKSIIVKNCNLMGETQTIGAIYKYISSKDPRGFTRQDGVRSQLLQIYHELLKKTVGVNVEEFVKNCLLSNNLDNDITKVIEKALIVTATKIVNEYPAVDERQLYIYTCNLIEQISNKDYNSVSRGIDYNNGNNMRNILESKLKNLSKEEIYQKLASSLNVSEKDYDYIKTELANKVISDINYSNTNNIKL